MDMKLICDYDYRICICDNTLNRNFIGKYFVGAKVNGFREVLSKQT